MVRPGCAQAQNRTTWYFRSAATKPAPSFCLREKETAAGVCERMEDSTQPLEDEQEGEAETNNFPGISRRVQRVPGSLELPREGERGKRKEEATSASR